MNITWNASEYQNSFHFVPKYGEDVFNLLTVQPGASILDLGCGNGTLTQLLHDRGYAVTGMDASEEMLKKARSEHPGLSLIHGDAANFTLSSPVDAIFSNAVIHWIDANLQDSLIASVAKNLKQNGEFVFEFGGIGCAEAVHSTLEMIFNEKGLNYPRTFYFPSIGTYAPMLEKHGLRVEYAILFDRPTPQIGANGLKDWINMFIHVPFNGMDEVLKAEILDEAETRLRETLLNDGTWYIDYVRIRMRARKV